MKSNVLSLGAGLGALLLPAGPLPAAFLGLEVGVKANDFNILTFNVYAVFDNPGLDHLNAVAGIPDSPLSVFVKHGTLYQNAFGTDRPPLDLLVQTFPSLAYDTFVSIGVKSVGAPGGQPVDEMIFTPAWPGFGSCAFTGDNLAWAIIPFSPQGNPFDPVHSFPGDGRVLVAQFSTADGDGINGQVIVQVVSDGLPATLTVPFEHDLAPPSAVACSACGPGSHWMDCCAGGLDDSFAEFSIRLDTLDDGNLDGKVDLALYLGGPALMQRSNVADDSAYFPGFSMLDDHFDVVDSRIVDMQLVDSAAGVTLSAGGSLAPSRGSAVELVANNAIASGFFDVFFELDLGGGTLLYNQEPLVISAQLTCAPAQASYIYYGAGLELFTSPVPGQGAHVANLVRRAFLRVGQPIAIAQVSSRAVEQ